MQQQQMTGKQGIENIVQQIKDILTQIEAELYRSPLELYNGSSIGQHFRHIYDFFQCLSKGVHAEVVDYAQRDRDLEIEQNPLFALAAFEQKMTYLLTLEEQMPIRVRADLSPTSDAFRPEYPSSIGREITFVHDHAVHHLAMIKIGLQSEAPQLLRDKNFGVAPSTIKFRQQEAN
jgi:hypothetical protein